MVFKQEKLLLFSYSCMYEIEASARMYTPVHAPLYLILLVAVFVCVVPTVQPVPLCSQV